jgi:hypothetical protein
MDNHYVGNLSAKIMFKQLKTLKEIDDYYYDYDEELLNYSLILLVDKNTQERIWAMYWYFKPMSFISIIIPSTYTLYSLRRRLVINNGPQWKEPFKISIASNSITNEEQMPYEFKKILFQFWDNKRLDYNESYIDRNSINRKITDDYDVYCTVNKLDNDEILNINYFMKSFVSINNPIKDLILVNENISKDNKRTSLPQTSIRDIASFINPKHGLQDATRRGGRKRKYISRKSRKKYLKSIYLS